MQCVHCGTEIADKALICFRCGRATSEPRVKPPAPTSLFERRRRSPWPMIVAIGTAVAGAAAAIWQYLF